MPKPQYYNIGADLSDKHSKRSQDTALIYEDDALNETATMNYGQVIELSNRLANALVHKCGLKKEDRVAILMSQSFETALVHIATYKAGGIALPLFVQFGPDALEYRLRDSGAKVVVVEPSCLETVLSLKPKLPNLEHIILAPPMSSLRRDKGAVPPGVHHFYDLIEKASSEFQYVNTKADDPALIIYTSGTTGSPKGALHAHRVLLGHLPGVEFPQNFFPQKDDCFWTPADWAWIGGLIDVLLPSMHHGVPVVAHRFKKFDPERAFALIEKYKIKNMFMPPTALKMMRQVDNPHKRYKLNVRSIGSGGESLGEPLLAWGQEVFGLHINEFYGQTECNLVLGNCAQSAPVRAGSMGVPIPGHVVDIVDDEGKVVPVGTVGNIGIKAPHPVMFLGYWNRPQDTKEKYAGEYLITGDMGKKDADGYFYFFGRKDDVIKSSGYRIGPAEIEDCLTKHPVVVNAAAIGVPDEVRGQAVKAFIVLRDSAKVARGSPEEQKLKKEIQAYIKTRLAPYQYPREVEFVDSLPMTTTGKVIRRELQRLHNAAAKTS